MSLDDRARTAAAERAADFAFQAEKAWEAMVETAAAFAEKVLGESANEIGCLVSDLRESHNVNDDDKPAGFTTLVARPEQLRAVRAKNGTVVLPSARPSLKIAGHLLEYAPYGTGGDSTPALLLVKWCVRSQGKRGRRWAHLAIDRRHPIRHIAHLGEALNEANFSCGGHD